MSRGLKLLTQVIQDRDMMGRLHADLFFQERFMLNEVGVKIKLIRSRDTFCLIGAASRVSIILDSEIDRVDRLTSGSFDDLPRAFHAQRGRC